MFDKVSITCLPPACVPLSTCGCQGRAGLSQEASGRGRAGRLLPGVGVGSSPGEATREDKVSRGAEGGTPRGACSELKCGGPCT